MSYDVWLVKASRKPVLFDIDMEYTEAFDVADNLFQTIKQLQKHALVPNGVSVQIVPVEHHEQCSAIEMGGLPVDFVKFQFGAY